MVDARIVDGLLKFQPDWPPMAAVDADIRFEADGKVALRTGVQLVVPRLEDAQTGVAAGR